MEEEVEVTAADGEIRPDWWVPLSIPIRTAGEVLQVVGARVCHFADLFVAYSNYEDGRLEFHNAAAAELEKIIEEGTDG